MEALRFAAWRCSRAPTSGTLDQSAPADFDIDPAKVQIAYAGGLADQVLFHICSPLRDLLHRPR